MGCSSSKQKQKEEVPAETTQVEADSHIGEYSGRKKLDPKNFMASNLNGETFVKQPGTIGGQQFIIEDCKDSVICLFDHCATVSVDECHGCTIIIGPTESSVFIRDCTNCKIVVACQQFRTRDCKDMDFLLYSMTQPIIETSEAMKFACYQFNYRELGYHFEDAGLNPWVNHWSSMYDFNKVSNTSAAHWSLLPASRGVSLQSFVGKEATIPTPDGSLGVELPAASAVPRTHGSRPAVGDAHAVVLVFDSMDAMALVEAIEASGEEEDKPVLLESLTGAVTDDVSGAISGIEGAVPSPSSVLCLHFAADDVDSVGLLERVQGVMGEYGFLKTVVVGGEDAVSVAANLSAAFTAATKV